MRLSRTAATASVTTGRAPPRAARARSLARAAACFGAVGLALAPAAVPGPLSARSSGGSAPTCYVTGGGGLEICREGSEAEGVLIAPAPCAFVRGVQLVRLGRSGPAGPVQAVFQGQSPLRQGRGEDPCPPRRASDPRDGGSLRTGRSPEQLATTLPPTADRFWVDIPEERSARRRGGEAEKSAAGPEGIGPRDPVAVSGRDWAGEAYAYVFMLGLEATDAEGGPAETGKLRFTRGGRRGRARSEPEEGPAQAQRRRVQIEARTLDFERFEIRTRGEGGLGTAWTPFEPGGGDRRRREPAPEPAPVPDEAGKPVASACTAPAFETHGLSGSISVIDQTYHYFYTDVLAEDCALPPEKRRTALYLRTAKDLSTERVWSGAKTVLDALPPGTLVRVARAKGLERWAVSYTCQRPANAPGGPVADICLQYTADLGLEALSNLKLYADPVEAGRSPAYLGLRSGGDGSGRYDRSAHFWMTDAYGNLDTPGIYAGKGGFLTWLDRLAPTAGGREGSSLYGRPVYWATWTVRPLGAQ